MKALYWHRSDLRLDDLPALEAWRRRTGSSQVMGVVTLDAPRFTAQVAPGIVRRDVRPWAWWLDSVRTLAAAWAQAGSRLWVLPGPPAQALPPLVAAFGVDTVITAPFAGTDEARDTANVRAALPVACRVEDHPPVLLVDPSCLPFDADSFPDVFTRFRRRVEARWAPRAPVDAPDGLAPWDPVAPADLPAPGHVPSLAALGLGALPPSDPRSAFPMAAGEAAARAHLEHWLWQRDAPRTYRDTRNGLVGVDYSSKLSPWLATGALSVRRAEASLAAWEAARGRTESSHWVRVELLWREYFHHWARHHGARVYRSGGVQERAMPARRDARVFARWCAGETGEPFVDAGMRELRATGYLSNRLRQNVASWLTRTRGIDWRWGARWFESQLVDYDPCVNWGNWQYVSGVGNDPRDRTFDVRWQAERYDAGGAYRRLWGTMP